MALPPTLPPPALLSVCSIERLVDIAAVATGGQPVLLVIEHLGEAAPGTPFPALAARWTAWHWSAASRGFAAADPAAWPVPAPRALDVAWAGDRFAVWAQDNTAAPAVRGWTAPGVAGPEAIAGASLQLARFGAEHPGLVPVKLDPAETWSVPGNWVPPAATCYNHAVASDARGAVAWALNTVDGQAALWVSMSAEAPPTPLGAWAGALEPVPVAAGGGAWVVWYRSVPAGAGPRQRSLLEHGMPELGEVMMRTVSPGAPPSPPQPVRAGGESPVGAFAFDVAAAGERCAVLAAVVGTPTAPVLTVYLRRGDGAVPLVPLRSFPLERMPRRVTVAAACGIALVGVHLRRPDEVLAVSLPLGPD